MARGASADSVALGRSVGADRASRGGWCGAPWTQIGRAVDAGVVDCGGWCGAPETCGGARAGAVWGRGEGVCLVLRKLSGANLACFLLHFSVIDT